MKCDIVEILKKISTFKDGVIQTISTIPITSSIMQTAYMFKLSSKHNVQKKKFK